MSNIKQATITILQDYFLERNQVVNTNGKINYHEEWCIICHCGCVNEVRINSLEQIQRLGKNIVCKDCKHETKVKKFLEQANMILLPDDNIMKCNDEDCNLKYKYSGDYFDPFRCYCRASIKQEERILSKKLQETFPDAVLCKEYLYNNKHKIDIVMKHNDNTYYFEIDDETHFAQDSPI